MGINIFLGYKNWIWIAVTKTKKGINLPYTIRFSICIFFFFIVNVKTTKNMLEARMYKVRYFKLSK